MCGTLSTHPSHISEFWRDALCNDVVQSLPPLGLFDEFFFLLGRILVCEATPTCCCFSLHKTYLVFAGNVSVGVILPLSSL